MQRDRLSAAFPECFRCHITAKPTELTVTSEITFGVVSALVVNTVSTTIADYHADASHAKLLWDPEGP
ncbi:hypothetical protein H257_05629 [Aphanomyces astaci]|uniref:Uncharacterized protein n=1 Tax=Aphanomyces astaci TaxID=112090 RepID=W4GQY5_APHAT|nr:hypothetical protein H257_05629 [Aphanomyces astaci]ETV82125.1 hypothetical protein H257_05629 [Aphanomyces astaci]|eukprot:XP_009828862.1 hypothetical protein H257_05629 [Aphanomyces astaci]